MLSERVSVEPCTARLLLGCPSFCRGLYRVHQFSKLEMFVVAKPEDSDQLHEELHWPGGGALQLPGAALPVSPRDPSGNPP